MFSCETVTVTPIFFPGPGSGPDLNVFRVDYQLKLIKVN